MVVVKIVLAIVLGVVLGFGVVIAGDAINHLLFPAPAPADWPRYVETAPFTAFIGLVIAYALAAFVAAFMAARGGRRAWAGWIAGGLLTAATYANLFMIPHPLWMTVACVVLTPLGAWFGARLGVSSRTAAAA